jgi:hypothetical protein
MRALEQLNSGNILCGGVGSGKSRTAIAYYYFKECKGELKINGRGDYSPMENSKDLYIITTAKKRDSLEFEQECAHFGLSTDRKLSMDKVKVTVDSWNNIKKYVKVQGAVFIFDEQRVVGSGTWVKSFITITKKNHWILATATPGDVWTDYIPVFVANGFYKNRTEFLRIHAVYNRYSKYPKIDKFIECGSLYKQRDQITVSMDYSKPTTSHERMVMVPFDERSFNRVMIDRWNVFENKPIREVGELCHIMRKVVNSDISRIHAVEEIIRKHPKVIIFYNFDYELEMLRTIGTLLNIPVGEWNGHNHQSIPRADSWVYLVQYTAGAEGWNCIETDTTIFFSQSYSYKTMVQASGRIDRVNTPFRDLYYYHIRSNSPIDLAIRRALRKKQDFNINSFEED